MKSKSSMRMLFFAIALFAFVLIPPLCAATDIGVDVGIVTRPTALFSDPNISSPKIKALVRNEAVVLVSRDFSDGWAHVIQYSTGREGWVHWAYLELHYTKNRNHEIDLPEQSSGGDELPQINVSNKSNRPLYLHIDGMAEIKVESHSQKKIDVQPGVRAFNGALPNVSPIFGHKAFVNGESYTWEWSIQSGIASHNHGKVDPMLVANFNRLQADIAMKDQDLKNTDAVLNEQKLDLDRQESQVRRDKNNVDYQRTILDRTDQTSIDDFNALVNRANAEVDSYQLFLRAYNLRVSEYNAKLAELNTERDDLQTLSEKINKADEK